MKNHRFLWLRNRTTDNRKCEKARNIKEKRTIEMFNTVLRALEEHHSSPRDNKLYIPIQPSVVWLLHKKRQSGSLLGCLFCLQNLKVYRE